MKYINLTVVLLDKKLIELNVIKQINPQRSMKYGLKWCV